MTYILTSCRVTISKIPCIVSISTRIWESSWSKKINLSTWTNQYITISVRSRSSTIDRSCNILTRLITTYFCFPTTSRSCIITCKINCKTASWIISSNKPWTCSIWSGIGRSWGWVIITIVNCQNISIRLSTKPTKI